MTQHGAAPTALEPVAPPAAAAPTAVDTAEVARRAAREALVQAGIAHEAEPDARSEAERAVAPVLEEVRQMRARAEAAERSRVQGEYASVWQGTIEKAPLWSFVGDDHAKAHRPDFERELAEATIARRNELLYASQGQRDITSQELSQVGGVVTARAMRWIDLGRKIEREAATKEAARRASAPGPSVGAEGGAPAARAAGPPAARAAGPPAAPERQPQQVRREAVRPPGGRLERAYARMDEATARMKRLESIMAEAAP